jgi:hypothetical protein
VFNLRILGNALQSTHLTLHYGSWAVENLGGVASLIRFPIVGASLAIYFTKNFGFQGKYWNYLPNTSENGMATEGARQEYMVFIDYSFLRVQATAYDEKLNVTSAGLSSYHTQGILGGLQIFF